MIEDAARKKFKDYILEAHRLYSDDPKSFEIDRHPMFVRCDGVDFETAVLGESIECDYPSFISGAGCFCDPDGVSYFEEALWLSNFEWPFEVKRYDSKTSAGYAVIKDGKVIGAYHTDALD